MAALDFGETFGGAGGAGALGSAGIHALDFVDFVTLRAAFESQQSSLLTRQC